MFMVFFHIIPVFRNRNLGETVHHYESDLTKLYEPLTENQNPTITVTVAEAFIRFGLNPWELLTFLLTIFNFSVLSYQLFRLFQIL